MRVKFLNIPHTFIPNIFLINLLRNNTQTTTNSAFERHQFFDINKVKNNQNGFNSTQQLFLPTCPSTTLPTLQSSTTTFTFLQPSTTTFTLLQPSTTSAFIFSSSSSSSSTTIWIATTATTSAIFSSIPKGAPTAATSSHSSFSTATTSPSSSSPTSPFPSRTSSLSKQPNCNNSRGGLIGWPLAVLNARFCSILLRSEEEEEEDPRSGSHSL